MFSRANPCLVELAEQRIQPGQRLGERGDRREHAGLLGQQGIPALAQTEAYRADPATAKPHFSPGMFHALEADEKITERDAIS